LIELPEWRRVTIRPWTADEARRFLAIAKSDPLYPAFLLLVLYGLRVGEVLGLDWDDIDFDSGKLGVRQQLQRIRREIFLAPVKTHAGKRVLPLLDLAREVLKRQAERQSAYQEAMGSVWAGYPGRIHHLDRAPGRATQPCSIISSHLRGQRRSDHQGASREAHSRIVAQRSWRTITPLTCAPGRDRTCDPLPRRYVHGVQDGA